MNSAHCCGDTSPSPDTGSTIHPARITTAGWASATHYCATALAFIVLANGRLEAEIKKAKRTGVTPAAFGAKDAAEAVAAAQREHFPPRTIIFLDQEEGGRLTADQSAYLLAWTEGVAHSGYLPGAYASGQPVGDGPGKTITTIKDIREQVATQASARDRDVGLPGRMSARQRLQPCNLRLGRQRNTRCRSVAVRAVSAPQGDHCGLQQDLRLRRQLLCSRTSQIHLWI